jgi:hypothetical protein
MSYLIEDVHACGLDPRRLWDTIYGAYGVASAPVGQRQDSKGLMIEAILIDRKADRLGWSGVRRSIERAIIHQNGRNCLWSRAEVNHEPAVVTFDAPGALRE